jgi:3-oxoacyl-[acyl-carrier-protein] synthase-3
MSRILDWSDRGTCVLFGDGAGAAVLSAQRRQRTNADRGNLNTRIFSDGRLHDLLYTDGGVSSTKSAGLSAHARQGSVQARGHEHRVCDPAIHRSGGLTPHDIDWFVPHQANQRILDGTARKLASSRSA